MNALVVIENAKRWPLEVEGAEVASARAYLTEPRYAEMKRTAVFNLCRQYGYQSLGYYVSLLAEARGHRPFPPVSTLQGHREVTLVRLAGGAMGDLIERSLAPLKGDRFELSVYFGRNLAQRYDRLSRALFNEFPIPMMRASFQRLEGSWRLVRIRPIATAEIPDQHREFVLDQARRFFNRPRMAAPSAPTTRYDLAILWSPDDEFAPSDERAIRAFERAFAGVGMGVDILDPHDIGRVGRYDALFLRETTRVNHHTYRFARRAAAEGLVVVDDPDSIVRCTNKVFQHEAFHRRGVPCPPSLVVHEGNADDVAGAVGFPCVLKRPDGAFSQGVTKVGSQEELVRTLPGLLEESSLVIAQAWTPSAFDWRIGVLGGRPLWACRYHMVAGHWQIAQSAERGTRYGKVEAVALEDVPGDVVEVAVEAAGLMGTGLYGVDAKVVEGRTVVMEVNDNPNIEVGYEDGVLGESLYQAVAGWFLERLEARGRSRDG